MTLPAKAQDLSRSIFNDLFFQHYYPSIIITPATFPAKSECLLLLLLEEHHHLLWLYDNLLRHELSACDFSAVTVSVWNPPVDPSSISALASTVDSPLA